MPGAQPCRCDGVAAGGNVRPLSGTTVGRVAGFPGLLSDGRSACSTDEEACHVPKTRRLIGLSLCAGPFGHGGAGSCRRGRGSSAVGRSRLSAGDTSRAEAAPRPIEAALGGARRNARRDPVGRGGGKRRTASNVHPYPGRGSTRSAHLAETAPIGRWLGAGRWRRRVANRRTVGASRACARRSPNDRDPLPEKRRP